jgi:hypothetical protein
MAAFVTIYYFVHPDFMPIPVAARSAATSLLRLWVQISAGAWLSVLSVVCCQIEVSAGHSFGGVLPSMVRRFV